jgi:glutamate/tyrosine decarboxylase-like PLP-dependent enzyme
MSPNQHTSVLPSSAQLKHSRLQLVQTLPQDGIGHEKSLNHIRIDVCPALSGCSQSPNYYGFVTGGATPTAAAADNIVTEFDQNVGVHLPDETIATDVEDRALSLLCQLLDFVPTDWRHRTFTTGATASNILGMACGRQYVIEQAAKRLHPDVDLETVNVGQVGLLKAMNTAGLEDIRIITTVPHSSLRKAASIVGIGRDSVILVGEKSFSHQFNLQFLEQELAKPKVASIVSVSCGDVNTGFYATTGDEMETIRKLCDRYGAWIHVDGGKTLRSPFLLPTRLTTCSIRSNGSCS